MRLRLFERLRRLVSWRFSSQGERDGRSRDSRASGAEASGRHRRNSVGGQSRNRAVAGVAVSTSTGRSQPPPPLQPPAGLPRRDVQPPRLAPRTSGARPGSAAMPPLPRNYTPGQGGGVGRARIREAPFGAAPLDTATRPQPDADQASGPLRLDGPRRHRASLGTRSSAARRRPGAWPVRRPRPVRPGRPGRGRGPQRRIGQEGAGQGGRDARERHPRAAAVRGAAPERPPGDGGRAAELRRA